MGVEIRTLTDADAAALEGFLAPLAESSMFLRASSRDVGLAYTGARYSATYVGAFDHTTLLGVVSHTWTGNLLPQAPPGLAADLARAAVAASGRPPRGAIGPADQVHAMLDALGVADGPFQRDDMEGLYRLDLARLEPVPNVASVSGRTVAPCDREPLLRWFTAFEIERLGVEPGPGVEAKSLSRFADALRTGRGYVLERGATPVAYAGLTAALPDIVQIGGVYTPRSERGRGYARAVVAHAAERARARGVTRAVLFTADANIAAIRAYRSLGFERCGAFRLTLLR